MEFRIQNSEENQTLPQILGNLEFRLLLVPDSAFCALAPSRLVAILNSGF